MCFFRPAAAGSFFLVSAHLNLTMQIYEVQVANVLHNFENLLHYSHILGAKSGFHIVFQHFEFFGNGIRKLPGGFFDRFDYLT
jgi:hypothetical protein